MVKSITKDKKILAFWVVIYVAIALLVLMNAYPRKIKSDDPHFDELSVESLNDLEEDGAEYNVCGSDPYIVYQAVESGHSIKQCRIELEDSVAEDLDFTVYYRSADDDGYSEARKDTLIVPKGQKSAVLDFTNADVSQIRLDYDGAKGDTIAIASLRACSYSRFDNILSKFTWPVICALIILAVAFWRAGKMKYTVLRAILLIIILATIAYFPYISGQTYFIFYQETASDSAMQFYPMSVYIADRLQNGLTDSLFSFNVGLGNPRGSVSPSLSTIVSYFGAENVAYLYGIRIYILTILSGVLAYLWLKRFELSGELAMIIAVGYEFNTMLVARGAWTTYPIIAFLVIAWLWAFEGVYRRFDWKTGICFGIINLWTFVELETYYKLIYLAIFEVYILCRVVTEKAKTKKLVAIEVTCLLPVFALQLRETIESVLQKTSSERFVTGASSAKETTHSLWQFDWNYLLEAFTRSIGQDIGGGGTEFAGVANICDGPGFYCGILVLMMVPVAWYNITDKKKKTLILLGGIAGLVYIVAPELRYVVNGFASYTFKMSSFWITLLELLCVVEAAVAVQCGGIRKKSIAVFNVSAAIVVILLLVIKVEGKALYTDKWWTSTILVIVYAATVNAIALGIDRKKCIQTIAIISCAEVILLSYDLINNRDTLTAEELAECYYGDVNESVQQIKTDDSTWYRLETLEDSYFICSSLVQDYYGTKSYVGGTQIGAGVRNYYSTMDLPRVGNHFLYGVNGNVYAMALTGVKYQVVDNQPNTQYGLDEIGTAGEAVIYQNELALPIAYVYDKSISNEELQDLSYVDRNKALLQACTVETAYANSNTEELELNIAMPETAIRADFAEEYNNIDVTQYKGKLIVLTPYFKQSSENDTELHLNYLDNETNLDYSAGYVYCKNDQGLSRSQRYSKEGVLEFLCEDITSIWFSEDIASQIEYVDIEVYDPENYYAPSVAAIEKLQQNGFVENNRDGAANRIEGTICSDGGGILATSIPYNAKWNIYIDGEKCETMVVNTGFVGTEISAGKHDIVIEYEAK